MTFLPAVSPLVTLLLPLLLLLQPSLGLASSPSYDPPPPSKVIVSGAAGRTGKLVFSKILKHYPQTEVIGLVRTEHSAKKLLREGYGLNQVAVCDVTTLSSSPSSSSSSSSSSSIPGLEGAESMVICTSAVPVMSRSSMVRAMIKAPLNLLRGKKALDFRSLKFKYRKNQHPERVDYEGQKAQIDLARSLGVSHVVVVSSMGGTDPKNFLNTIGRKKDGSGGDILLWKRKAEQYLINSGLHYTIIHPGGLRDTPPPSSSSTTTPSSTTPSNQVVLDVDDKLLSNSHRSICRMDVAHLCVAALTKGRKHKVSFDAVSAPVEEGHKWLSPEQVFERFLKTGQTNKYD